MKFGHTGMDVSRLCLGCMSYGMAERGGHQWVLNEEQVARSLKEHLSLGLIFSIQQMFIQMAPVKRL